MADVSSYGRIQSEYATVSGGSQLATELRATQQALKPLRPPTAPAQDLDLERRKIVEETRQPLILIQLALFIVFLCLLAYVVLPTAWANGISFLLLCVGIASGIFLKR